ncbi:serine hydrolase domain-containing protein [Brevirhabdus sp.]|uniref:serine hydrolase domain-containing protein n=1 Tax=Brevirhabdus sp. TaxID=2004514 RepID=UPI00405837ED
MSVWIGCRIDRAGRVRHVGPADARFPYWSFTKTVIAICALRLAERGALDLDAPLTGAAYSLRQLLGHTAGLPDYATLPDYHRAVAAGTPPWSRAEILDRALARGHLFAPGRGWAYSNIGYMLAREALEHAARKPLSAMVAEWIAGPLGLRSVLLACTPADFAALHWPQAAGYDPGWVYHGCLTGTAPDAARLLHALFQGDLLGRDALAQMRKATPLGGAIEGRPWTACGYGLGLMSGRMGRAGRAMGHSGAGPFCVNAVYHFPDAADPVTVACFTTGPDEGAAEHRAAALAGAVG